ncbi:CK1 family protein kinase [Tritrichomonas foetus]|uniref:non-specific serine/threonine protein kinase n=1 Tax=Tritrichomonas foetus TaxID=1144522 RepID=A0A1J4K741_9EUKA|nr:CK1 family protein kinase [Tritrichomonas foetus]|eukprot:OHT06802.1 CK1 family protein kinase [Tritrichomonas foetus]
MNRAPRDHTNNPRILFTPDTEIDGYRIIKHIGKGGYADVYKVEDISDGKFYAMKIEALDTDKRSLEKEFEVIKELNSMTATNPQLPAVFPTFYSFGDTEKVRYLVMSLFGPSLSTVRKFLPQKKFSMITSIQLSLDMLDEIEAFHNQGYIHRDIKPSNFLVNVGNRKQPLCLIDFGLAQKYIDPKSKKHIKPNSNAGFAGTYRYASLNAHYGKQLSRRDDLISWFYSIIEIANGRHFGDDKELTVTNKEKVMPFEIGKLLPFEFVAVYRYITSLQFTETPNYDGIRNLIHKAHSDLKMKLQKQQKPVQKVHQTRVFHPQTPSQPLKSSVSNTQNTRLFSNHLPKNGEICQNDQISKTCEISKNDQILVKRSQIERRNGESTKKCQNKENLQKKCINVATQENCNSITKPAANPGDFYDWELMDKDTVASFSDVPLGMGKLLPQRQATLEKDLAPRVVFGDEVGCEGCLLI